MQILLKYFANKKNKNIDFQQVENLVNKYKSNCNSGARYIELLINMVIFQFIFQSYQHSLTKKN